MSAKEVRTTEKDTELSTQSKGTLNLAELGLSADDLAGMSGIDNVKANDIKIPEAKLVKKATKEYDMGDIILPDGRVIKGLEGETIKNFCVVNIQETRVMFPEKYVKGNRFICRSFDNEVGADDGEYAGRECASCPFSKFENGEPSKCKYQLLLLCTMEDESIFYITINGVNVSPFKKEFYSTEMLYGMPFVKKALGGLFILGAMNLELAVKLQDTDNGEIPIYSLKVNRDQQTVDGERFKMNMEKFSDYKTFADEAMRSTASMVQDDESRQEETSSGKNAGLF